MRKALDHGNRRDIERVAQVRVKRADATFAEDHLVVSAGHNVCGAEQQLLDRGGHSTLQKYGLIDFTQAAEQVLILHVPRSYLQDVAVRLHHFDLRRVHYFADDEKAVVLSRLSQQFQALLAESLEAVGRRARFERSSSQQPRARPSHPRGNVGDLRRRLDRTWPRRHYDILSPDRDAFAQIEDRPLRPAASRGQLEWMGDRDNVLDPRSRTQRFKLAPVLIAVAHDSDHRPLLAVDQVRLVPALLDASHHVMNFVLGCIRPHVDNHFRVLANRYGLAPLSFCAEGYEPRIRKSTTSDSSSASAAATSGSVLGACKSR